MPTQTPFALTPLLEVEVSTAADPPRCFAFLAPQVLHLDVDPQADVPLPRGAGRFTLRHDNDGLVLYREDQPTAPLQLGELTELWLEGGLLLRLRLRPVVALGPYLLTGRLGCGGMAEVFAARQTGPGGFDRPAVIKLLRCDIFGYHPESNAQLLAEARIAARINHPNVVTIYEVGEEQGALYIAMERLIGLNLLDLQTRLSAADLRLPPLLAAALMAQVFAGLDAAHRPGEGSDEQIIHRDISPNNLMLLRDGTVKIIDFGIAKLRDRLLVQGEHSGFKGKPAYIAPEQLRGAPADARSDLFAAGVIFYELCRGGSLFGRGSTEATLGAVLTAPVPPLADLCPDVPADLSQLVGELLDRDPAARPQSAAAVATRLAALVAAAPEGFASPARVAAYLRERGLSLEPAAPEPLRALPAALRRIPTSLHAEASPLRPPRAPPPPPPPDLMLALPLPPPGALGRYTVRIAGIERPLLVHLREAQEHLLGEPLRLPLCDVPGLLPAPLYLEPQAGALTLAVRPDPGSRAALYLDAGQPQTRRARFTLAPSFSRVTLEIGHRRERVLRLACDGASAPGGPTPLRLVLADLGVVLCGERPARRLLSILALVPAPAPLHLCCVQIT